MRNAKENSRNAGTRNAKSHRNARPSLVKYLFRPQPHTEEPIDDSALLGIKYVSPLQEGFSASSALLRNKYASQLQVIFIFQSGKAGSMFFKSLVHFLLTPLHHFLLTPLHHFLCS